MDECKPLPPLSLVHGSLSAATSWLLMRPDTTAAFATPVESRHACLAGGSLRTRTRTRLDVPAGLTAYHQ